MGNETKLRHILIFDDDADYRKLLVRYLGELFPGVELTEYDPVADGAPEPGFDWSPYDLMLLDYNLSLHNVTGLQILEAHAGDPSFPATIMLTGAGNEDVAIMAMKSGIYDYLRKHKLDRAQLKESILGAYTRHLAALKQRDAVTEACRVAAKAFRDYKSRYESLHATEIKRLHEELTRLQDELNKNRQLLQVVETEKQHAVQSLEEIEQKLKKFRDGATRREDAELLETNDTLEKLNKGIEDSERKREDIAGEIRKNLWRQEQEQMKLEQIEEDLRLFNEEFGSGKNENEDMIPPGEFKKILGEKYMSEKTDRLKKEQEMYSEITGQLDKDENK